MCRLFQCCFGIRWRKVYEPTPSAQYFLAIIDNEYADLERLHQEAKVYCQLNTADRSPPNEYFKRLLEIESYHNQRNLLVGGVFIPHHEASALAYVRKHFTTGSAVGRTSPIGCAPSLTTML